MDNNNIFPNKIPNFTKFSQIEIFPKFTKCSQDGILKGFPRIPSKSFPKLKFQNFTNVPNKFAHRNIFQKHSQHGIQNFPNSLGQEYSQQDFPTKILKLTFKFTNSRFSQQQIFPQKSHQNFTKSSKLFPNEKQTFPNELFKFSQKSDHLNKGWRFPNLKYFEWISPRATSLPAQA